MSAAKTVAEWAFNRFPNQPVRCAQLLRILGVGR
jgi:hypothetical protein